MKGFAMSAIILQSELETALHLIYTRRFRGPQSRTWLIAKNGRKTVPTDSRRNIAMPSLSGHRGEAIAVLRDAVDHGLPVETALAMDQDEDLKLLHSDQRFQALVAEVKNRRSAAKAPVKH